MSMGASSLRFVGKHIHNEEILKNIHQRTLQIRTYKKENQTFILEQFLGYINMRSIAQCPQVPLSAHPTGILHSRTHGL